MIRPLTFWGLEFDAPENYGGWFVNSVSKVCESCVYGKNLRTSFPVGKRENDSLMLVHADICGPIRVPSARK